MFPNRPSQATFGLLEPIIAIIATAMEGKNHGPNDGTSKFARDIDLIFIFNTIHTNGAIEEPCFGRLSQCRRDATRTDGEQQQNINCSRVHRYSASWINLESQHPS